MAYRRNEVPTGITRGDDRTFTVYVPSKPFAEGDSVTMTVRQGDGRGEVLVSKTVTEFTQDGKALINLIPSDTNSIPFGVYSYDVQVTFEDIGVKTIITPSEFVIGTEDTWDE